MTFKTYLAKVKAGDPDVRGLTTEAYNLGVLDPSYPWDVAYARVKAAAAVPVYPFAHHGPSIVRNDLPDFDEPTIDEPSKQLVLPFPRKR